MMFIERVDEHNDNGRCNDVFITPRYNNATKTRLFQEKRICIFYLWFLFHVFLLLCIMFPHIFHISPFAIKEAFVSPGRVYGQYHVWL